MTERFAVIGCGTAAQHIHMPALKAAGVEIVAFASRTPASAEAACARWGSGTAVPTWAEAIARDDVDAVVIAAPNAEHRAIAVAAAGAGKHVLVDKPMACTTADVDEMIAAADEHGVVLVPFQNTRFAPPFVAAHAAVRAGAIGEVTGVRAAFGHGGPQAWAPNANWFFERSASGGGCLIDLGVHVIDLVRHVSGEDIVRVSAMLHGVAGDVETDAQLLVGLANGAIGSVHASWSSRSGADHQLTVVGTQGTVHLDSRTPLTLFTLEGERERVELPSATSSPLDEFLAAVRGERSPSVTAGDGRAAVAVVEAAYRSAATGSVVEVT